MKLLWTTSHKVGAKLIRWGLKTDCSHFAICFDEDANGLGFVFHSSFNGAKPIWLHDFIGKNEIIHCLTFRNPPTLEKEEQIWKEVVSEFYGQPYDYPALLFWVVRVILHRLFGMKLPTKNYWGQSGKNLCTAIADGLQKAWPERFRFKVSDSEMISPHDLYRILSDSQYLEDDNDFMDNLNTL